MFLKTKWEGPYAIQVYISKPNFHRLTVFSPNLVPIEMKNANVTINRPIYAVWICLKLRCMLFYGFLKPKCGINCKLLYMITDCFFLEFKEHDIYEIIKNNSDFFNTYDYPEDNVYNIERKNNKVLGKFKDEAKGSIITKFFGLRSKMYAWKTRNKITKVLKGIKRNVVDNKITFEKL